MAGTWSATLCLQWRHIDLAITLNGGESSRTGNPGLEKRTLALHVHRYNPGSLPTQAAQYFPSGNMNFRQTTLFLSMTLCCVGATADAGLLSPEAVMYGMSPAEAHRMRMFAAELQLEGGMGSTRAKNGGGSRDADRARRSELQTKPGALATNELQANEGNAGSTGSTHSDGPSGPSQSAMASCLEITRATLVAYFWRESRLFVPAPYLDGVFRPPRNNS